MHRAAGFDLAANTDAAQAFVLDASNAIFVQPLVAAATATPFVINVVYDASVTGLATSNPTLYAQYVAGVNAAVGYLEHTITSTLTVTIDSATTRWAAARSQAAPPAPANRRVSSTSIRTRLRPGISPTPRSRRH